MARWPQITRDGFDDLTVEELGALIGYVDDENRAAERARRDAGRRRR